MLHDDLFDEQLAAREEAAVEVIPVGDIRRMIAVDTGSGLAAVEPGTASGVITPAWARKTTGCSAGLSAKVAAGVRDQLAAAPTVDLTERKAA